MKNLRPGSAPASCSARFRSISLLVAALWCLPLWADLPAVQAEPNLERRSELAIGYANQALTSARQAYQDGKYPEFQALAKDVGTAAELCVSSLEDSGKGGRRYPKYYKRGELAVRSLLRRIETLRQEVSIDDREQMDQLKAKVEAVHDRLLHDLLEKKK